MLLVFVAWWNKKTITSYSIKFITVIFQFGSNSCLTNLNVFAIRRDQLTRIIDNIISISLNIHLSIEILYFNSTIGNQFKYSFRYVKFSYENWSYVLHSSLQMCWVFSWVYISMFGILWCSTNTYNDLPRNINHRVYFSSLHFATKLATSGNTNNYSIYPKSSFECNSRTIFRTLRY